MTEEETREALSALGLQAHRLRQSIQSGRTHRDDERRATAVELEVAADLAERSGETLMATLLRLLSTMFEDMRMLEEKIRVLADEAGIGLDKE
jgi:hypothetical protein